MTEQKNYKYKAFISYRHIQPDVSIAQAVHTMVETFKVPKELMIIMNLLAQFLVKYYP